MIYLRNRVDTENLNQSGFILGTASESKLPKVESTAQNTRARVQLCTLGTKRPLAERTNSKLFTMTVTNKIEGSTIQSPVGSKATA